MESGKTTSSEQFEESYVLVPKRWLESISRDQKQILSILEKGTTQSLQSIGDYITEAEAKKLLNKGTTWFHNMKTSGKLAFTKLEGTTYYDKSDLIKILDENKTNAPSTPFKKKNS